MQGLGSVGGGSLEAVVAVRRGGARLVVLMVGGVLLLGGWCGHGSGEVEMGPGGRCGHGRAGRPKVSEVVGHGRGDGGGPQRQVEVGDQHGGAREG